MWIPIDQRPDFNEQPIRQFILVEGTKEHSGSLWQRIYADTAFISKDDLFGYRQEDLNRIKKDGDMDWIERITHWMPAKFPTTFKEPRNDD